ncbi:MAG TPA: hypothetical protein EYQ85_00655 [Candidatus Poseidoniales archaeon]|jgi:hypothetical protein|nr:MAG: hypothetical protein CXT68_07970 [Euryarchaeota archaeon]HIF15753.1 hypothetical protein [Candidatus Poseidoniales archaeon]
MSALSWVFTALGVWSLGWLSLRHWKKVASLDARLRGGDVSLLQESDVEIEEVIQAPQGSQLHHQQMLIVVDQQQ